MHVFHIEAKYCENTPFVIKSSLEPSGSKWRHLAPSGDFMTNGVFPQYMNEKSMRL